MGPLFGQKSDEIVQAVAVPNGDCHEKQPYQREQEYQDSQKINCPLGGCRSCFARDFHFSLPITGTSQ